jgi:hypothetical protein
MLIFVPESSELLQNPNLLSKMALRAGLRSFWERSAWNSRLVTKIVDISEPIRLAFQEWYQV